MMLPSSCCDRPELPNSREPRLFAPSTVGGCAPYGSTNGPSFHTPSFLDMAAAWGRAHVEALWNSHLHQPDADRPFAFDKRTQDHQAIPAGHRLEQRLSLVRVFLDLLYFHIFAYATV